MSETVCVSLPVCVCVCVCVSERERERERECVHVCVCVCLRERGERGVCVCVHRTGIPFKMQIRNGFRAPLVACYVVSDSWQFNGFRLCCLREM